MSQDTKGHVMTILKLSEETNTNSLQEELIVELVDYGEILAKAGYEVKESNNYWAIGEKFNNYNWTLHLSATVLDGLRLLNTILPVLKELQIPFRILRTNYLLNKANGYGFGLQAVGKFIDLYPRNDDEAIRIISIFSSILENFGGPEVLDALRIGQITYASTDISQPAKIPFLIPKKYRKKKRKRIIGKYYVPVQLLRSLPKGDTIKAINLRRLKLSWCLIKQGKKNATDDFFGRDMISRISWQFEVLKDLSDLKEVPEAIDFYKDGDAAYLVLDYTEGVTLRSRILQLCNGKNWKQLTNDLKKIILEYFLKAVLIVQQVHAHGYVHRDLTDENFIVSANGALMLIDFEISWSVKRQYPSPAFGLGTFGYMSPQQFRFMQPTTSDDVYSLGAILAFVLTGMDPIDLLNGGLQTTASKMKESAGSTTLCTIALDCLSEEPRQRPTINNLVLHITTELQQSIYLLSTNSYELEK